MSLSSRVYAEDGADVTNQTSRVDVGLYQKFLPHGAKAKRGILLVFSVTPFKIDQNKNQNRPIDKVQNLGNERRYVYKDPRQDSGQRNFSYTRYPKKCFTQIYRDLYGDAMLVLTWMSSNMADGNQQKHLFPSFACKSVNLFFKKLINIKVILFLIHELFR